MNRKAPAPLREVDVTAEDRHQSEESDYAGLRTARVALRGMADAIYMLGGLVILGGIVVGAFSITSASSRSGPSNFSPYSLVIAVALIVIGVALFVVGWNVSIASERLGLEIETIARLRQITAAAYEARDDARATAGKLELHLRAITASAARTAEAVETLVGNVKRKA